jgi:NAD(P)-dependent dehydrogenase (short-subunit alcohol dehydrogenase family)
MAMDNPQKVWFITGVSSGFGRLLAEQALAKGDKVVATARKPEQIADLQQQHPETALTVALDVTQESSIESAVDAAIQRFGRVDAGAIEEATEDEYMPVFETNVFGLIRVTRALLPHMRAQRSGYIVNLSSIGGLIGMAGWGYYNASKFAVEGLSEALAGELAPLGIHVILIEPGAFRTDFLGRSGVEARQRIPDYDSTAGKTRQYFHDQAGKQPGDPANAAAAIIAAVEADVPPKHLVLGTTAFNRMSARLEDWKKELEAWRDLSLRADFDAGSTQSSTGAK